VNLPGTGRHATLPPICCISPANHVHANTAARILGGVLDGGETRLEQDANTCLGSKFCASPGSRNRLQSVFDAIESSGTARCRQSLGQ